MSMFAAEEFSLVMKKHRVVFFAGAGISLDSCLPSVNDIIDRTGRLYLPSIWKHSEQCRATGDDECRRGEPCHFFWLRKIQPEHFYGILLGVSGGDMNCLEAWRVLHQHSQERFTFNDLRYDPTPNLVHLVIAQYSFEANVPVFTVNFDTMFEEACSLLGIPYHVYLPEDKPPLLNNLDHLPICKVHGSIQSASGKYTPQTLRTTMNGITMSNERWGAFLQSLMAHMHLTLVGYSGRDVDYYPYIKNGATRTTGLRPFWFGKFKGVKESDVAAVETAKRSQECNATLIEGYPSEHFRDLNGPLYCSKLVATKQSEMLWRQACEGLPEQQWDSLLQAKNALLDSLVAEQTKADVLEDLLWLRILTDTGHCMEALKLADKLMKNPEQFGLNEQQKLMILADGMNMAREQAMYSTYRKRAQQLLKLASGHPDRVRYVLNARVQITSSYMMEIPPSLPFGPSRNIGDLLNLFTVFVRLQISDPLAFRVLAFMHADQAKVILDSPILAEFRIRRFALLLRLVSKLRLIDAGSSDAEIGIMNLLRKKIQRRLVRYLQHQLDIAYRAGNYQTIISVYKYLYRITQDETWYKSGTEVASMSSDLSALTILQRDKRYEEKRPVEHTLTTGGDVSKTSPESQTEEAEKERAVLLARENGNVLNEVKCLVELAHFRFEHRKEAGGQPLLIVEDQSRFEELIESIARESPRLGRFFRKTFRNIQKT